jgi:glyoxylase-like metal-dependent hydrolase (beta-lactamase superfamily II)
MKRSLPVLFFVLTLLWIMPSAFASEIHDAVLAGDLPKVAALLEKDPGCVNEKNERGWTPLLYASGRASSLDMVRLLVEHGADVNASQKYAGTVLDLAFDSGDTACVLYLQGKGARFSPIDMGLESVRQHISRITCRWGMLNNIAVSAGPDGILIVDSGFSKRAASELQGILARLNKGDLRVIVNSHPHGDHTAGNVLAGEQTRLLDFANLERMAGEGGLAKVDKPLAGAKGKAFPAYYTFRFNGEEIRLIPCPGLHSGSDILVHFTGAGVVFMGDLLLSQNCPALDKVAEYMDFLDTAIDVFPAETIFICGHGRDLTHKGLRGYRGALQEMIDIVRREAAKGKSLEQMLQEDVLKSFKDEYSFLDWLGPDTWVRAVVRKLVLKSAVAALEQQIRERGIEAAQAEFREHILGNKDYNVSDSEINALGYRLLRQEGKTAEAIAVFTLNTEAFPQSWNVWDSLGEALWNSGETDKAETCYEKSLALNPESPSGMAALSQLRGHKLDSQGETGETVRFKPGEPTGLRGPYLGQEPPGLTPRIFAPGIVSSAGNLEFSLAVSPDGKEIYFTRRRDPGGQNVLMVCRLEADGWRAPVEAEFAKGFPSNEPHITPDGRRLYFGCNRIRPGAERPEYAIWVVERSPDGAWGEPRYHGPGMFVSAALSGNLYMTDVSGIVGRDRPVVVYPWTGDRYGAPQRAGGGVNTPVVADHAFIAPDESFILFDSPVRPGGQGGYGDLWVCFKNQDGAWSEAFNLGDTVNTPATNFCPALSPDGKYLFFGTCRDIYWVSAEVIEKARPATEK